MRVAMRFFGSLATELGEEHIVDLGPGATVANALRGLGVREDKVSVVIVNGSQVPMSHLLADGDRVMVVPPVIGG